MAETTINRNQLDLGDLSGALIEQSNMITAGKKEIVNSLSNKGVTGLTYTDSLSKMADAIDSLNTDGVGGVNPNFPVLIAPHTASSSMATYYLYNGIMPNGFMYVSIGDEMSYMDIYNPTDFTLPDSNSSQQNYRLLRINKSLVDTALGETLSTPFNIIQVPNTNNFVAFAGGKVVKIIPDYTNYTITATAVTLVADDDSSVSATTASAYRIIAADFTTDQCLIWTGNTSGKVAWANMTTGAFRSENTTNIFWKSITSSYINAQVQPIINYSITHASAECYIIKINWNSINDSTIKTASWSNDSDACYDPTTNCFYFVSNYSNNTCKLITYDLSTDTFSQRTITTNMTGNMLGPTSIQSYSNHTFNNLAIINIPNTDYRLFYNNEYCFVLDGQDNLVPYIPGTNYYYVILRYGYSMQSMPSTIGLSKCGVYVNNGNIYSISNSSNNNYITLYKIDIKYNKVLAQQVIKNNQSVLYGALTNITTSNIDGGPFDATTVTLPVSV